MQEEATVPRGGVLSFLRNINGSIVGAALLFVFDGGFEGAFLLSTLSCPVWILLSLIKNAAQRPGWGLAVVRVAIPALTMGLLRANGFYQLEVAEVHARQVIAACEQYHADHGEYPKKLDELVPQYFDAVPVAKHCLGPARHFSYHNFGSPLLYWQVMGFYRKTYDFENRSWWHVD